MLTKNFQGEKTEYASPCVLLLGGFDGLHVGHKRLIDCAKTYNLPIGIMTIEGGKGQSLFTHCERQKIFRMQGLNFFCSFNFTEEFKNTSKEDFLSALLARFNVKAFVCGEDFRFGKGAQGTPAFISAFTGIPVHAIDVFSVGGKKVSTSFFKEYLKNGEVEQANRLLLTPFFLSGKVEEGRKQGRTFGFPTANIAYPVHKFSIKEGVYAVSARLNKKVYHGVANCGACPTFGVLERKLETYFEGFEGDIYGEELDVYFVARLRDIQKFENEEALKVQIQSDILRARTVFTEEKR